MPIDLIRHAEIRNQLDAVGLSISALARDMGIRPASITVVSQGFRRSKLIEKRLADALGTTPEQLFPERYSDEEDGIAQN